MDAQYEIDVIKFPCIHSDEGRQKADDRFAYAKTVAEKTAPKLIELRTYDGHTQWAEIFLDLIIFYNQGWIKHLAGDQWGGMGVEYLFDWLQDDYADDLTDEEYEELPDYRYKLIGRLQFDRTIDGLVEAFLLYEERQQHIDKFLEEA